MLGLRRSIATSFASRYSGIFIQLITSLIIARLLTPKDIGIFSVGFAAASLCHTLRDFGVTNYLIQEKELTPERIRSAQTVTLAIGWGLGILLLILSTPFSFLYQEPGVAQTLTVVSFNFFLLPFGSVTAALLQKEMRFSSIYFIQIASTGTQALTCILLAKLGLEFMSLAWGALAGAIATTGTTLFFRRPKQPWLPGLLDIRRVFAIGARFSGASLLSEIGLVGPDLIAGRLLNIEAVGYLSRATGTVTLLHRSLIDAVLPVAVPYFAKITNPSELSYLYRQALVLSSGIAWPAQAGLAVAADPVIRLLFGEQWLTSIMPTRILCFGMAMWSLAIMSISIATGLGKAQLIFRLNLIFQPVKLGLVVATSILGLPGIAVAMAVGDTILALVFTSHLSSIVQIGRRELARALIPSAALAASSALFCFLALCTVTNQSPLVQVLAAIGGSVIGWILVLAFSQHPLKLEATRMMRSIRARR